MRCGAIVCAAWLANISLNQCYCQTPDPKMVQRCVGSRLIEMDDTSPLTII